MGRINPYTSTGDEMYLPVTFEDNGSIMTALERIAAVDSHGVVCERDMTREMWMRYALRGVKRVSC